VARDLDAGRGDEAHTRLHRADTRSRATPLRGRAAPGAHGTRQRRVADASGRVVGEDDVARRVTAERVRPLVQEPLRDEREPTCGREEPSHAPRVLLLDRGKVWVRCVAHSCWSSGTVPCSWIVPWTPLGMTAAG